MTPNNFDIETVGKDRLQPIEIGPGLVVLTVRKQPAYGAFRASGERNQSIVQLLERGEGHMRVLLDGPVEVRGRHQVTQVRITLLVLGQQDQPIDCGGAQFGGARNGQ